MKTQIVNLAQVAHPKDIIINKHVRIPSNGTAGTKGVLKGLGRSGRVLRKTITLAHTIANAKRVPILVKWPTSVNGAKAAKMPTIHITNKLDIQGV